MHAKNAFIIYHISNLLNLRFNTVIRIRFLTFFRQIALKNGLRIWAPTFLNYKYGLFFLSNWFLKCLCLHFSNGFEQINTASYVAQVLEFFLYDFTYINCFNNLTRMIHSLSLRHELVNSVNSILDLISKLKIWWASKDSAIITRVTLSEALRGFLSDIFGQFHQILKKSRRYCE